MTDNQKIAALKRAYTRASDACLEMSNALQTLGALASGMLGYKVLADYCGGGEIEFRPCSEKGGYDDIEDMKAIRLEEIITELKK